MANDAIDKLNAAQNEQDVWNVLKQGIANLVSLEIKTIVTGGPEEEELYTCIDLFQADRTSKIHKSFLKDADLAPLREFHAEQVKLAETDIQHKIDLLEQIGKSIIQMIKPKSS